MKEKDIDDEKLAKAKAEAKAAEEGYKDAQEKTGDVKKEIAEQAKIKEAEMKKAEALKQAA